MSITSTHHLGSDTVFLKESFQSPFDTMAQNAALLGLPFSSPVEITQKQKAKQIHYQLLDTSSIDEMLELQGYIYEMLPSKALFVKDNREDIKKAIENGFAIGVLDEKNAIVGYRLVAIPEASEQKTLEDDLYRKKAFIKPAHLETTIILPTYRGNQLQYKTLIMAQKLLKDNQVTDVLCTVSPYNVFSLNNVMRAGLRIKALKRKYADKLDNGKGLWRFILHKPLKDTLCRDFHLTTTIEIDHINTQQKLLGRGYEGVSLVDHSKKILYVHR